MNYYINFAGNRNWENFNTFGHVEKLTSDDYKNPAYFTVEVSES